MHLIPIPQFLSLFVYSPQAMARDETLAEVWYNVGHLALGIGDVNLAYQCFRLAIAAHADHAESYNNLGETAIPKYT